MDQNRETLSRETSRKSRVNFYEISSRGRTGGSSKGRANSASPIRRTPTNGHRGSSTGSIPASNNRPMRNTRASVRGGSSGWSHSNPRRAQPSNSGRPIVSESQMTDTQDHLGVNLRSFGTNNSLRTLN